MKVQDIYSQRYFTCTADETLEAVVQRMVDEKTNTMVVVDEAGKYLGIITAKHLIMAVLPDFLEDRQIAALAGEGDFEQAVKDARGVRVEEFMTTEVHAVKLDTPIVRVAATVLYQNESRLPVIDENEVVIGIVTRTHIKQAVAKILGITSRTE